MKHKADIPFEDSLNDDWSHDLNMVEVPLGAKPIIALGVVITCIALIVLGRVAYLSMNGAYYASRAEDNANQATATPAPRGIIYDAEGQPLVENKAVFDAVLDAHQFIANPALQSSTLAAAQDILGIPSSTVWSLLQENEAQDFSTPVELVQDITQTELVNLQALGASSTIKIQSDFQRYYPDGPIFSSVVGYVGRVSQKDLAANATLTADDFVGKMGVEQEYDAALQGVPGVNIKFADAHGHVLGETQQSDPTIGSAVHLTIDGGLQTELYHDIAQELALLNRPVGIGLILDPQTGAVLSLVNFPSFDNNAFMSPASSTAEIKEYLTSSDKPLFNRILAGQYQPGSTIKPLVGIAALKEGVISADRQLYSPGYLMVPNRYNSSTPTKYMDWESHGYIDLSSALAESSDVYFYIVGGGSPSYSTPALNNAADYGIQGLGAAKLFTWWTTFGLGKKTGIDLPNEAVGFLPTPAWWSTVSTRPWTLGDTYNVSIGQGSLAVTPIQLLSYIDAIANGGKIYKPFVNASSTPVVSEDLTYLLPEIQQVQQGMRAAVADPRGTAYTMKGLPAEACAKTGSAQVKNNQQENALFVGYFPCDNPKIALLLLIEDAKEGSLNAVPIAKNVFDWYYYNRMTPTK
jgi:penicillin-binding protein 2